MPVTIYLTGLLAGLGLIVAIGAQNAYLIRQGIRRAEIGGIVLICILSDVVLICAGTLGIGMLVSRAAWLLEVLRWAGAAYLVWFAVTSLRSAARPAALTASGPTRRHRAYLTAAALTWLNPHVYLDTVVLLGSLANQHGPDGRWSFAAGAITGSVLWFSALGYGARALAGPLSRTRVWQALDLTIGVTMLILALRLVVS
ncbi:LysE/ArgO family amino acid transporter [Acidipropionibacterium acidipropionici]|uniref:LysE/ArgO family amino acid transporter n=1 Tax=Acidipropionibacterium acidipropionici TaxID=1748 RepID=UPI000A9B0EEE|nr:LysE/ArgO family amino acid transporter [Acidipropionibacterium acidipropionici]